MNKTDTSPRVHNKRQLWYVFYNTTDTFKHDLKR